MGKTAFMFPGQGTQFIGMGAECYQKYACSRSVYLEAEEVTGLKLRDLCFQPNDRLDQTEYTQIAMYVTEVAMLQALLESGQTSDVNLGLSLGEYSTLTASGVLSFADGCLVVRKRGMLMEHEVLQGKGGMAAILGMDSKVLECLLQEKAFSSISIANYNCPGQIVISGEIEQLKRAIDKIREVGAKRAILLNVSGPFHSPMLKGAGEKLAGVLDSITIAAPKVPYVANLTAQYVTSEQQSMIRDLLVSQVYSPVRFEQSIGRLIDDGVDTFVEIGPGKTLSGFVNRIAREKKATVQISQWNGNE